MSISVVHPSVVHPSPWSVFEYLRDSSLVFSNSLHEVREPSGYKRDRAWFLKKNLGVTFGGKTHFGNIFYFFPHIFASSHQNVLKFHIFDMLNIIYHLAKRVWPGKSGSGCIVGTRLPFLRLHRFFGNFGVFSHYVSDAVIWRTWSLVRVYCR